jgi:uncharacterized protein YrrD
MDETHAAPPSSAVHEQVHLSDPHSYLRPQLRVKGEQGKTLGTVLDVERDADGALTGFTMRHGLLVRKCTRISVAQIKQMNDDAVVIALNAARLNQLPRVSCR